MKYVSLLKWIAPLVVGIFMMTGARAEFYAADFGVAPCTGDCYTCTSGCAHKSRTTYRASHHKTHHKYSRHGCRHYSRNRNSAAIEVFYVWPTVSSCGCGEVWVRPNCGPCEYPTVMYSEPMGYYDSFTVDDTYANYGPDMDMRTGDDQFADPGLND